MSEGGIEGVEVREEGGEREGKKRETGRKGERKAGRGQGRGEEWGRGEKGGRKCEKVREPGRGQGREKEEKEKEKKEGKGKVENEKGGIPARDMEHKTRWMYRSIQRKKGERQGRVKATFKDWEEAGTYNPEDPL